MKPAGRERDIEIAKLKGWIRQKGSWYDFKHPSHGWVISLRKKDIEDAIRQFCKWSTDRNRAWELWDELPDVKNWHEDNILGEYTVMFYKDKKIFQFHGKDFADCVSQAWIAWKEATR